MRDPEVGDDYEPNHRYLPNSEQPVGSSYRRGEDVRDLTTQCRAMKHGVKSVPLNDGTRHGIRRRDVPAVGSRNAAGTVLRSEQGASDSADGRSVLDTGHRTSEKLKNLNDEVTAEVCAIVKKSVVSRFQAQRRQGAARVIAGGGKGESMLAGVVLEDLEGRSFGAVTDIGERAADCMGVDGEANIRESVRYGKVEKMVADEGMDEDVATETVQVTEEELVEQRARVEHQIRVSHGSYESDEQKRRNYDWKPYGISYETRFGYVVPEQRDAVKENGDIDRTKQEDMRVTAQQVLAHQAVLAKVAEQDRIEKGLGDGVGKRVPRRGEVPLPEGAREKGFGVVTEEGILEIEVPKRITASSAANTLTVPDGTKLILSREEADEADKKGIHGRRVDPEKTSQANDIYASAALRSTQRVANSSSTSAYDVKEEDLRKTVFRSAALDQKQTEQSFDAHYDNRRSWLRDETAPPMYSAGIRPLKARPHPDDVADMPTKGREPLGRRGKMSYSTIRDVDYGETGPLDGPRDLSDKLNELDTITTTVKEAYQRPVDELVADFPNTAVARSSGFIPPSQEEVRRSQLMQQQQKTQTLSGGELKKHLQDLNDRSAGLFATADDLVLQQPVAPETLRESLKRVCGMTFNDEKFEYIIDAAYASFCRAAGLPDLRRGSERSVADGCPGGRPVGHVSANEFVSTMQALWILPEEGAVGLAADSPMATTCAAAASLYSNNRVNPMAVYVNQKEHMKQLASVMETGVGGIGRTYRVRRARARATGAHRVAASAVEAHVGLAF